MLSLLTITSNHRVNEMSKHLTPSQENYLEHIWHLTARGSVRAVDLADSVGVKLPSVTKAVNKLVGQGLVQHKHYGNIGLTQEGRATARRIVQRDRCITDFLRHVLQMSPESAESEACRLEHVLGDEVLLRLQVLVEFFEKDAAAQKKLQRLLKKVIRNATVKSAVMVGQSKPHA